MRARALLGGLLAVTMLVGVTAPARAGGEQTATYAAGSDPYGSAVVYVTTRLHTGCPVPGAGVGAGGACFSLGGPASEVAVRITDATALSMAGKVQFFSGGEAAGPPVWFCSDGVAPVPAAASHLVVDVVVHPVCDPDGGIPTTGTVAITPS